MSPSVATFRDASNLITSFATPRRALGHPSKRPHRRGQGHTWRRVPRGRAINGPAAFVPHRGDGTGGRREDAGSTNLAALALVPAAGAAADAPSKGRAGGAGRVPGGPEEENRSLPSGASSWATSPGVFASVRARILGIGLPDRVPRGYRGAVLCGSRSPPGWSNAAERAQGKEVWPLAQSRS